jgi:hypothetical protein
VINLNARLLRYGWCGSDYSRIIDHLRPQSANVLSQQRLGASYFPNTGDTLGVQNEIRSYEIAETLLRRSDQGADPIDARPGFVRLLDYCQEHGVGTLGVRSFRAMGRARHARTYRQPPARVHAGGIVAAMPAILSRSCAHRMWRPHIAQNTHWRRSGIDRRTTRHAGYTQSQRPTSGLRD